MLVIIIIFNISKEIDKIGTQFLPSECKEIYKRISKILGNLQVECLINSIEH